jgi:HK97 family phage portal protein
MSLLSKLGRLFLDGIGPVETQARSDFPSWEQQIAAFHKLPQPWAPASVDEALSVPAIFRAVTLISNTVGMLNLETYRNRVLLTDPMEVPRITVRPNPRTRPRDFWRDTAFYLSTRGEAWWWIARRDIDDNPIALFPVPPWEVIVEENPRDRLTPTIRWASRKMDNDDMRQITYLPGRSGRGMGPLQMCGAAVSVAVEAQHWAANFFSGSVPSIIGTTADPLSPEEAKDLDEQWAEKPSNLPRWLGSGVTVKDFGFDPSKAQLTDSRRYNDTQAAQMFGIPATLLEANQPGASLVYQNVEGEYNKLIRTCIQPNYLEPTEQEMSDLLTRTHTTRFNTNEVTRADLKTRSDVFKNLREAGVPLEVAAQIVGFETLDPDAINIAPVPASPPGAEVDRLPPDIRSARSSAEVRCDGMRTRWLQGASRVVRCNKLLSTEGVFVGACPRCNKQYAAA